jgi:hypothetical protein
MRPLLAVLAFCCLSMPIWGDMGVPGHTRVPRDLVIETDEVYPDHRFFLQSLRGLEPLPLAPGEPYRIDGQGRNGTHRIAYVIAVPRSLVEKEGEGALAAELSPHNAGPGEFKVVPGVLRSEMIDFRADVPFYDSRDRVIDRYRLEMNSAESLRLVWLGQNEGSPWLKGTWIVVGLSMSVSIIWGGWWIIRRVRRRGSAV